MDTATEFSSPSREWTDEDLAELAELDAEEAYHDRYEPGIVTTSEAFGW